jgi:hypothetical protein
MELQDSAPAYLAAVPADRGRDLTVPDATVQGKPKEGGDKMTRPRVEVLREYEDYYGDLLTLNPAHRESIHKRDVPEGCHRWLVELDCGCTTEALTYGEEHPPIDGTWIKALGDENTGHSTARTFVVDAGSRRLGGAPGFLWCSGHGSQTFPWREVAKWLERHERWSSKTGERYASWTILLSCGHVDSIIADFGWQPEHGHKPQPELAEKMRLLLDRDDVDDSLRQYIELRLPGGWPKPETGAECNDCVYLRRIVSFEPIGPLTWPGDDERPSREVLTRRLHAAEAKADRLREQLAEAEAMAEELKSERDLFQE